jgi:hypothetical protein
METKAETNQVKGVKNKKNRQVDVIVKAHDLYPLHPTEKNVDDNTELLDDEKHKSSFGASKKNYETIVFMGFDMKWDIEVEYKNGEDKDYNVELVSVTHNPKPSGNPNLFDVNPLKPKKHSNNKSIYGTIVHSSPSPEDYTIHFQIFKNDKDPHPFHLDPKLKINPE